MSGGRFDYINDTCKREIFGWYCEDDRVPNVFEDVEISELIYDVFGLIHDYDWYASSDTSEETWLKQKSEFKKKWLKEDEERVKRIIDESIERCKTQLYKTFLTKG